MKHPIEFTIPGSPVSQQSRSKGKRRQWTQTVQDAALQHWPRGNLVVGNLLITITCFFNNGSDPFDVDNVPKLILDALKKLVFDDDSQITDLICRKRNLDDDLHLVNDSDMLEASFQKRSPFLYIVVTDAPYLEAL